MSVARGSMAAMSDEAVQEGDGQQARTAASRRSARGRTVAPRRLDESMTLLREVMERPLDPGYATAAERRAAGAPDRGRVVTVVLAVVCGLLVTWSVVVLRAPTPASVKARELLVQQIEDRSKANDAAKKRIAADLTAVRRAQDRALTAGDPVAAANAARLAAAAGDVPVDGPGVVVQLEDAPGSRDDAGSNSDPRGDSSSSDGRVFDRDVQTIVNGLWAAGAEAIAVNGQRLTSLSAIRSAGEAILVDYRPLVPPYRVEAIGDPQGLQTAFAASSAGAYLQSLQDNFGVIASIEAKDSLQLPGSGSLSLRRASAAPAPGASGSASTGSGTRPASGSGPALPSAATTVPSTSEATP